MEKGHAKVDSMVDKFKLTTSHQSMKARIF